MRRDQWAIVLSGVAVVVLLLGYACRPQASPVVVAPTVTPTLEIVVLDPTRPVPASPTSTPTLVPEPLVLTPSSTPVPTRTPTREPAPTETPTPTVERTRQVQRG